MGPYKFCNEHLLALYHAISCGDVKTTYEIEHQLSSEEECVACAYALKAQGNVRKTLTHYLQDEGFMVSVPEDETTVAELRFWLLRLSIIGFLFVCFISFGTWTKSYLVSSKTVVSLGIFGFMGAFLLTLSSFLLIEQWVLE